MTPDQRMVLIRTAVLIVGLLASPATMWRTQPWDCVESCNRTAGLSHKPLEIVCLLADPPPRQIQSPVVSCPAVGGLG
jgi:hypothetical protein